MVLKKAYTNEECRKCYNEAFAYRMMKYNMADCSYQSFFKEKYEIASETQRKEKIFTDYSIGIDGLRDNLMRRIEYVSNILEENKPIINRIGKLIEESFKKYITSDFNELDKIIYICKYIKDNVTYSIDLLKYCINTPPGDGFDFDFKDGVPVDYSIYGIYVIGQGACDDITNFACYLGRKMGLDIDKVFTNYHKNLHSLNVIRMSDGKISYIDLTRLIRGDKSFDECVLVSEEVLNKNNDYSKDLDHDAIFTNRSGLDLSNTYTVSNDVIEESNKKISSSLDKINEIVDYIRSQITYEYGIEHYDSKNK